MKLIDFKSTCCLMAALMMSATGGAAADNGGVSRLPKTDAKPADMSKPVKVFLILGQSNAVGLGSVTGDKPGTLENAVKTEKLYPFLADEAGNWVERKDVRNVQVMVGKRGGMSLLHNEWMTVKGRTMGVEYGVGHQLGNAIAEPVMVLKSCIGNRSLGWDLLPPGSKGYDFTGKDKSGKEVTYTYAGYQESPMKWEKGTAKPEPINWYAGKQWDDDIANAKKVLSELGTYYPEATRYEVAGFFWWQGEKDAGDEGLAARYEENLVNLIKALRKEFDAPEAKFVMGTIGEVTKETTGNSGRILEAMMAVDGKSGKYPEFKGNVATVYTHGMARGGGGNGHYGKDSRVYMDVGLAMGETMNQLLKSGR
jgi:Carbohydrate esterase, sialic acid-specific acetylesterase